jgi:acetolactate synthase-1/2/3 large subunit
MLAQEALATMLVQYGATHFFHVPVFGWNAMKRLTALGATPVVAHDEKAAAYMADGYARISGRPGVCGAQAIGGTNLAAGLRDAYMARAPVIAFTGGVEPATRHKNAYQEHDDMPVFEQLTKFNTVVDGGERLPDLLRQAYRAATTGTPRPVHLQLCGVSGASSNGEVADDVAVAEPGFARVPALRPLADSELVDRAAAELATAERPIALIGGGVHRSGAGAAVVEFLERRQRPAVASLNGLGVLPEDHHLWVGVVGGYAREQANTAASEADLVVVIGSSLGGMTTRHYRVPDQGARVIHIDIDPEETGRIYRNAIPLAGDVRAVIGQLDGRLPTRVGDEWLARIAALRAEWRARADAEERGQGRALHPARLWRALSEALPDDAIVVADTGHVGAWSARHLALRRGHTVIRSAGSLGWAFPAAIGVKCAAPARPVVCLTGDAGFYYHIAELETARRYGVNVVVVVNNNAGMSQEAHLWTPGTPEERNWRFEPVDFAEVARSFGCGGWVVETGEEVEAALKEALQSGMPAVIDARTDPTAMAPTVFTERDDHPAASTGEQA